MTLDGFLAAFALTLTIYAVVPSTHRLRASIALWLQVPVAIGALGIILYLEYFKYLEQPCSLTSPTVCAIITLPVAESAQTAKDIAFVVVLVWALAAFIIYKAVRPSGGTLVLMRRIVDVLNDEQRYAELIGFVEPNLPLIGRAACRRLPLQRLADQFESWMARNRGRSLARLLRKEEGKPESGWGVWRRVLPLLGRVGSWLPLERRAEGAAADIIRVLVNSPGLLKFICETRPYFGLSLLKMDALRNTNFAYVYLYNLIRRPGSTLYLELEHNQNLAKGGRYALPERNRLLHFLFFNAHRAEALAVWKPIGDYVLKLLHASGDRTYLERLNRAPYSFEKECLDDPTWAAISFFDIMVHEAAHQGVAWHMWLYYMPDIVKGLVEGYDDSGEVDPTDEFPTLGCRLIYEAFNALGSWTGMVSDLAEDCPHRSIEAGVKPNNANIPQSAALATGRALVPVVMSDTISPSFARYMVEVVARNIRDLYREGDTGKARAALVDAVAAGGSLWPKRGYAKRLRALLAQLDYFLLLDVPDLVAAADAAIAADLALD